MNSRSERILGAVIIFSLIAMLFSPCHFGPAKAAMADITMCTSKPIGNKSLVDQQIQLLQSTNNGCLVDNSYVGYIPSFSDSIGKESVMGKFIKPMIGVIDQALSIEVNFQTVNK